MIGFATPALLLALAAVPLLWILLRAVPPAPIRRRFPGVALLLGLDDRNRQAARTPWWLLLLRMAAVSLAILGFAGPVLNPGAEAPSDRPLLLLFDGGWAEAPDWSPRLARAASLLDRAERQGRALALAQLTEGPAEIAFRAAEGWRGRLAGLQPRPWAPQMRLDLPEGAFDTVWLSDGLDHPGRAALAQALAARGSLTVVTGEAPIVALLPPQLEAGKLRLSALRLPGGTGRADLVLRGPDPSGQERDLARETLGFEAGRASVLVVLPSELRNRVSRAVLDGAPSAGKVALAGDQFKRRKVALVAEAAAGEGLQLLAPLHYLRQALAPSADLLEGAVADVVPAKPDVIILADVSRLPEAEAQALQAWVEAGGLLLRFAGPRLAAADMAELAEEALMPVRLRQGGLTSGGAMSWGAPKRLAPFDAASPFHGLALPPDVVVRTQVLAEPGPDLAAATLAALEDGTPLVTRKALGRGQVVLFHIAANAEWSDLPLSGLFVAMLERLAVSAGGAMEAGGIVGLTWSPERVMDGFGALGPAGGQGAGLGAVRGEALAAALVEGPTAEVPPGLYRHEGRIVALGAVPPGQALSPGDFGPATREGLALPPERALKGPVLALAFGLFLADILGSLAVSGRLIRAVLLLVALGLAPAPVKAQLPPAQVRAQEAPAPVEAQETPAPVEAQETPAPVEAQETPAPAGAQDDASLPPDDSRAIAATEGVVLAHVLTGDEALDELAEQGLQGLSDELYYRTAVEPLAPMGVDIEKDELAFFPFLYWPITASAPTPSAGAYARLNRYLRSGGMILFDTRDAEYGQGSPEAQALRRIAAGLDIPALEPIPPDHVLTRTFYLLQTFPGRFDQATLWVEAAPPDASEAEGMPFRNLNDGVTPVVVGANDYASAWAVDGDGMPVLPVGRGAAGEDQREYAYRFGINLIMHVLTGNYKSDQVHVPALLERLGP
jgi:hypothetical protein